MDAVLLRVRKWIISEAFHEPVVNGSCPASQWPIVGAEETAPLFGKIPASFLEIPYLPLTPPPLPAR
jgi:hypothetical protein